MTFDDLNSFGEKRKPFLFISDFKAQNLKIIALDELDDNDIEFSINEHFEVKKHSHTLEKLASNFSDYEKKFNSVMEDIKSGNTYLLNLTQPSKIRTSLTLKEIYANANAHYKLRYKDEFVCFSPEQFICIRESRIHTFPMKGTIDAQIPDAKNIILSDKKEMAEHIMVVDLLRNDLSIVASDVRVEKFRYVKSIDAGEKRLLQVSSHISGSLFGNWHEKIGDILKAMLPAGSISGAPKKSTLDIIHRVEMYERGFFSGVFGVYDGKSFDSGVMIRYIEKTADGLIYKSGGGITLDSDAKSEYNELLDKIYLP
ncbi:aminodeoxychorismate synthase component I [Sulfurimonas sp.]|uniref:aminodeoxychorismate synthase component I n=1 Tax=Sulfurimonas sp. TaxID=2022749 RepID=UPI0025EE5986|nr:aminodeoxychorismate synthase component I [Sulfurimonas sp.]MDD5157479.1 aminodeoxychorismate synthase component I [Sulfurimonas sp.]